MHSFWINKKGSPYYKDRAIILKGVKPKLDDDVIIKEPININRRIKVTNMDEQINNLVEFEKYKLPKSLVVSYL